MIDIINNQLLQKLLNISFIIRIILSIIVFKITDNIKIHYIFLFLIDLVDHAIPQILAAIEFYKNKKLNLISLFYIFIQPLKIISKENVNYYRYVDKLADIISYILFLNLLSLNISTNDKYFYYYIILFRIFGMFTLYITQNKNNLIYFPDLFKEFIGYQLFINNNPSNNNFILIFIFKIIFEYFKLHIFERRNN
jgi:hypothetical protein